MTQTSTAAPAIRAIIGFFDGIIDGQAHGWAFHPSKTNERLRVEIVSNGEVVGLGVAEHYREDLAPAGIGDGHHAFCIPLSYELFDGQAHSLTAREAATDTSLSGGTHELEPERRTKAFDMMSRGQGLKSLLEQLAKPEYAALSAKATNVVQAYRLACILQECGQLEEACDAWFIILRALGDNPVLRCKLGENFLLQGKYEDALDAFQVAASADLRFSWAHLGIGSAQRLLGHFVEAEEALQVAQALHEDKSLLQKRLAEIQDHSLPGRVTTLISEDQSDNAITLLKKRLLIDPDNSFAMNKLNALVNPGSNFSSNFSEQQKLQEVQKQQRLLEILLDDAELVLAAQMENS